MKKIYFCAAAFCLSVLSTTSSFAQFDDSSTGYRALNGRAEIPLNNQQRETPVVNNITQVTQVSSGMEGSYAQSSGWNGGGNGTWIAVSSASCGGGKVVSGGGQCNDFVSSWARIQQSYQSGNSWVLVCAAGAAGEGAIYSNAQVVCVP